MVKLLTDKENLQFRNKLPYVDWNKVCGPCGEAESMKPTEDLAATLKQVQSQASSR
jgi:hypothetical protein